ncbi:histidine phosphatase family protein [Geodermatophilus sp. YIM 151500]|uniref:histidine phosphatase family protein n=1 Tax=Geodermatophilus sp. YIM 151500 TaxID=2984531 RepID=UPI0021E43AC0|nr:histidine phosphatase family protein [Geodermatophilus sp. YIM 151500]MCV2491552.1 histidine phosphatase family protein [Geodermatophilus sp. YIM 151500]
MGGDRGQIVVLRHGQTEWSLSGQHTGVTDLPLLPEGEEQARALAAALAGHRFVEVRVSPRQRAVRTAELAGLRVTATDEDLVELDYGGYEGRTTAEISEELGREWSIWRDGTVPGPTPGETLAAAGGRVDRVLDRVRERLDDGDVALVAHGHVLRVLTARWLGLEPEAGRLFALPAGSFGVLGHEHGRPVLTRWGLT